MHLRIPLLAVGLAVLATGPSFGQAYRNLSNARFATVASGPMQATILDVSANRDTDARRRLVIERVAEVRRSRDRAASRTIDMMRRAHRWRGTPMLGYADIVVERRDGSLVLPKASGGRAAADLTFTFPAVGATGSWTAPWEADIRTAIGIVYGEMRNVYGAPSWSGEVKILNGDNMPAGQLITDPNALSGGIYNVSAGEITFLQNQSVQSFMLNLTQMVAIAFRGPASVSYDAWERGMARAATVTTLRNVLPILKGTPSAVFGGTLGDLSVADPLWQALDRYEWLNQPALGNDRFYPVSKTAGVANTAGFPNMLVPRLQMAGTTWLKVLTEVPGFLAAFNTAYYAAWTADPSVSSSVPRLAEIASTALVAAGGSTIEGLSFGDWFVRQYILDTSVSPGTKLYYNASPLRPETSADDDYGIGVILIYYRTAFDALGNSDEVDSAGTCYPVYNDFEFANRLFLGAQYERSDIRDGIGTVAPTFFNTIGGDPGLDGRMLIAMDFPVNAEGARLYAAPRCMGKTGAEASFWGVVIGSTTGKVRLEADGLSSGDIDVKQGAFGASVDAALLSQPRRATLTYTEDGTGLQTVHKVITGYGEYVATLFVGSPFDSRTRTFSGGPQMVAFPIRPVQAKAAQAFRDPTSGLPLFTDDNLLMAQWRQSLAGTDKYLLYPNVEPITPGKGYWVSFDGPTTARFSGRLASTDREVTISLLHGWNQIGSPYETAIGIADLRFQYLADNVAVDLGTAVTRGWIVAQSVPNVGQVAIWDYSSSQGYVATQTLQPWRGYWIRVLVSEGVTITYLRPATRSASGPASESFGSSDWSVALTLRDALGAGSTAYLGQASGASDGCDMRFDAQAPPAAIGSVPNLVFNHTDWQGQSGQYASDIRPLGPRSTWEITAVTRQPNTQYTVSWPSASTMPRSTRMVLEDLATGKRVRLDGASSYTFNSGSASSRRFRLRSESRLRSALRIGSLAVRSTSGRAAGSLTAAFSLSSDAAVTAQIRSADGRLSRKLSAGRAFDAGEQSVTWDMRDDRGIAVPSGTYLLHLTATGSDGQSARAIHPVVVVR